MQAPSFSHGRTRLAAPIRNASSANAAPPERAPARVGQPVLAWPRPRSGSVPAQSTPTPPPGHTAAAGRPGPQRWSVKVWVCASCALRPGRYEAHCYVRRECYGLGYFFVGVFLLRSSGVLGRVAVVLVVVLVSLSLSAVSEAAAVTLHK